MSYFIKKHARNTKDILDPRVPAEAEIWYDITSKKLRYGDGLKTGGYRVQRENIRVSLSPAQLTANTNDFNPTGMEEAGLLILDLDAAHDLTGLAGGEDGREIWISVKNGSAGNLMIRHQSASSTAGNRFLIGVGTDLIVIPNQVVPFRYDGTLGRWVSLFTGVTDLPSQVAFTGTIAPTLAADTNDWNPAGLVNCYSIMAAPSAAVNLTGLAGGREGREIMIFNSAASPLTLKNNSAASAAGNRFLLTNDLVLQQYEAVNLRYNAALGRWFASGYSSGIAAIAQAIAAVTAGSAPGVSDTLANVLTTATGRAAGLAIALG
jgi:hypothetical protein